MSAREKIINTAETLFAESGFDATTTREITNQTGVNSALIYYYFSSKEALLDSILDRYFTKLNTIMIEVLEEEGELQQRLERVIDRYVDFLHENVNFSLIVQREACGGKRMDIILKHLKPMHKAGQAVIRKAYPKTRSGEMSANQLIISFYGMIINYFSYNQLLGQLLNIDLLSKRNISIRKKHLHKMLNMVVEELGGKSS